MENENILNEELEKQGEQVKQTEPEKQKDVTSNEDVYQVKEFPKELDKFNWGAFGLPFYWGIGNKVYLGLLSLIPIFNLVWMFVCGFKGNKWAWEKGKYNSVEDFNNVQNTWKIPGIVAAIIQVVGFIFSLVIGFFYFMLIIVGISVGMRDYVNDDMHMNNYYEDTYSESIYESSEASDVSGWTNDDFNSIKLAKEVTDQKTNLVTYKDGSSFKELVKKVGEPESSDRTGNIITAYWSSDTYDTSIEISYDLVSDVIIMKNIY